VQFLPARFLHATNKSNVPLSRLVWCSVAETDFGNVISIKISNDGAEHK
jgi:hypothetical protein